MTRGAFGYRRATACTPRFAEPSNKELDGQGMNVRIGIDFGGVIVRSLHDETGEDANLRSSFPE